MDHLKIINMRKRWILMILMIFSFQWLSVSSHAQTSSSTWYEFSPDGRECIVKKSDLATPWLNRLGNDVFFTWITHHGFIESFLLDPQWNGLTNPQNTSGRFYVRDRETGDFFQINEPLEDSQWECRVGLGYNKISNKVNGLETQVTYFVPRNDNVLIMLVEVKNNTGRQRTIDLFGQVEFNLGDPVKNIIYRGDGRGGSQFNLYKKAYMQENVILANLNTWRSTGSCISWPYTGFFTVNQPVTSYETIKGNFLGLERDYDNPEAVRKGKCTNTDFWSQAEYPWGVLHNTQTLLPNEKKELVYVLGMTRKKENIKSLVEKYSNVHAVNEARDRLRDFYNELIHNSITVETPDKENDRIINIWTKYIWRQFYKKSLNNGAYGLGLWSYGLEGERISVHPEQVLLPFDMEILKNSIVNLLRNQLSDTTQTELYEPTHTMRYEDLNLHGANDDNESHFKVPHHHQIWMFLFSTYYYLLETGDLTFLDLKLPYLDGTEASVWKHIQTAIAIATQGISDRGLPRIPTNAGDWMDEFTKISVQNKAESVMLGSQLCFLLRGFSEIADKHHDPQTATKWMAMYERVKNAINDLAWDGAWYIRAFSDRGDPFIPVGSSQNEEGKIYLNAQSWSIMSGVASPERATKALASVKKHLLSDYGPMVFYPPYTEYIDHIGTQTLYAPGFRNACIYLRPAGWAIIAACLGNQPALAYEMYTKASLVNRTKQMEQFLCEPYVYPENYNGPDHRLRGKGEFQWNLGEGTAWMWVSYVNYILGIRPQLDGLLVDPKIPSEWPGYKIKRTFRGSVYNIEVINPNHVSHGVRSISIDGRKIRGNVIPALEKGKQYKVIVMM